MTTETCSHKYCGLPIERFLSPTYKWSDAHGAVVPFHSRCSYAHPDYDVSKGEGAPFAAINLRIV